MKGICMVLLGLTVECLAGQSTDFSSDIPGDGIITCGPNLNFQPTCPGGVGTVNVSSGTIAGSLQNSTSSLGIALAQTTAFLTFAATPPNPNNPPDYNPQWLGPLGLNQRFQPSAANVGDVGLPANLPPSMAYFDATVPISGQQIELSVRNDLGTTLNDLSFSLGRDVNSLSTVAGRQDDGLTFGLYCSGQMHAEGTSNDCGRPENWQLLLIPVGPGTLNPADLNSTGSTFGDVLRFSGVNLEPGQTGRFTFFLTDYTSTRTPPGGVFTPANQSFVLGVAANVESVPEPHTVLFVTVGLLAIFGSARFFRTNEPAQHFERASAIGDLSGGRRTQD